MLNIWLTGRTKIWYMPATTKGDIDKEEKDSKESSLVCEIQGPAAWGSESTAGSSSWEREGSRGERGAWHTVCVKLFAGVWLWVEQARSWYSGKEAGWPSTPVSMKGCSHTGPLTVLSSLDHVLRALLDRHCLFCLVHYREADQERPKSPQTSTFEYILVKFLHSPPLPPCASSKPESGGLMWTISKNQRNS